MSLTDDDKAWLLENLTATEQRLEQQIARLDLKIDGLEQNLDLEDRALWTADRVPRPEKSTAVEEENLEGKIFERVETSLLTEFHKWASPQEARARTHAAALRAIDLEMEALSDRVAKLEPPAA